MTSDTTKYCRQCGKVITGKYMRAYCSVECRKKATNEFSKQYYDRKKPKHKCLFCGKPCRSKYCSSEHRKIFNGERRREKFSGCDEDCLNCKYSDCLKPASKLDDMPSFLHRYDEPKDIKAPEVKSISGLSGTTYSIEKINEGWDDYDDI